MLNLYVHVFYLSLKIQIRTDTQPQMCHCVIIWAPFCAVTLWPGASSFTYSANEVLALWRKYVGCSPHTHPHPHHTHHTRTHTTIHTHIKAYTHPHWHIHTCIQYIQTCTHACTQTHPEWGRYRARARHKALGASSVIQSKHRFSPTHPAKYYFTKKHPGHLRILARF